MPGSLQAARGPRLQLAGINITTCLDDATMRLTCFDVASLPGLKVAAHSRRGGFAAVLAAAPQEKQQMIEMPWKMR